MPIQIDEKDAQDLIDLYIQKQRSIKNQMAVLNADLKALNTKITDLKQALKSGDINTGASDEMEYNINWHWVKKIEFAITKAGKPLTTNEIVDILTDYQPEYISGRRSAIASVSATLSLKSGTHSMHKEFVKIISDWGGTLYDVWKEIPDPLPDSPSAFNKDEPLEDLPF